MKLKDKKDTRDYFNKHKPGIRLAKRRLQIGHTSANTPDQVVLRFFVVYILPMFNKLG